MGPAVLTTPAVRLSGVAATVAGRTLFRDVTCAVAAGSALCVIGPNGAGRSTLLQIMAGTRAPDAGTVMLAAGLRVGLLTQDPHLDPAATAREIVEDALADVRALLEWFDAAFVRLADHPDDPAAPTALGDLSEAAPPCPNSAWSAASRRSR